MKGKFRRDYILTYGEKELKMIKSIEACPKEFLIVGKLTKFIETCVSSV